MILRAFLVVFFILGALPLFGQRYIGLSVDNDLYFGTDRYYSSGIFLHYGKRFTTKKDSLQTQYFTSSHWTLGQEINTPSLRLTSALNKIDYPYNGWLFLSYEKEYFKQLDFGYGWGIKGGTTGANASLAKAMQNTYHRLVLNLSPLTWAYSLPQSYHLNFESVLYWGQALGEQIKWVQESRLRAGSFRTAAETRFGLQWGTLPGLPFFGRRLETTTEGISFFLGALLALNIHDYSLSGSLFTQNSAYDLEATKLRHILQAGLNVFKKSWRGTLLYNFSSPHIQTQRIKRHSYLNISIYRLL